jgi:hypothetical protein
VQLIRNRHLNGVWLEALKVISARARVDREYAEITGGILAGLAPARDALTLKVMGRTIDQAVYSLALQAMWTALKGPKHAGKVGLDAARSGAAMAGEFLQDPIGFFDWMVGVVRQGGELGDTVRPACRCARPRARETAGACAGDRFDFACRAGDCRWQSLHSATQ